MENNWPQPKEHTGNCPLILGNLCKCKLPNHTKICPEHGNYACICGADQANAMLDACKKSLDGNTGIKPTYNDIAAFVIRFDQRLLQKCGSGLQAEDRGYLQGMLKKFCDKFGNTGRVELDEIIEYLNLAHDRMLYARSYFDTRQKYNPDNELGKTLSALEEINKAIGALKSVKFGQNPPRAEEYCACGEKDCDGKGKISPYTSKLLCAKHGTTTLPNRLCGYCELEKLKDFGKNPPRAVQFSCGCFLTPGVALSCCPEHEYPKARIEHFKLELDNCQCELNEYQKKNFKNGFHGICQKCDKPVIITIRFTPPKMAGIPSVDQILKHIAGYKICDVPRITISLADAREIATAIHDFLEKESKKN